MEEINDQNKDLRDRVSVLTQEVEAMKRAGPVVVVEEAKNDEMISELQELIMILRA